MLIKDVPAPLLKRILFPPLIGLGCLLTGLAFAMNTGDILVLVLSAIILAYCSVKAVSCYRQVIWGDYDTLVATCVGVGRKVLRQYQTVRLLLEDNTELLLYLEKNRKWLVGCTYRVYFRKDWRKATAYPRISSMLATDALLGYEEVALSA